MRRGSDSGAGGQAGGPRGGGGGGGGRRWPRSGARGLLSGGAGSTAALALLSGFLACLWAYTKVYEVSPGRALAPVRSGRLAVRNASSSAAAAAQQ